MIRNTVKELEENEIANNETSNQNYFCDELNNLDRISKFNEIPIPKIHDIKIQLKELQDKNIILKGLNTEMKEKNNMSKELNNELKAKIKNLQDNSDKHKVRYTTSLPPQVHNL